MQPEAETPHVVIVGGGFAGLSAARMLSRRQVRITLIDRRNYHCFQPLLYQVATGGLEPADIAYPIRSVFAANKNVTVLLDEAIGLDRQARSLHLKQSGWLDYDYLILACGATMSYHGHDHWRPHAPGLKTLKDALSIRRRVLGAFEAAEACNDPTQRQAWMTFVIIGAGPTGVEMAGAIAEMARYTLARDFRRIEPSQARVILLHSGDRVLRDYSPKLSQAAQRQLEELGVELRLNQRATAIDDHSVETGSGRIESRNVIWAAGVSAVAIARQLELPMMDGGRVPVTADLSLADAPNCFVIGDMAAARSDGHSVPGVAPAAIQAGKHVARCIRQDLRLRPRPNFRYRDRGSLATIGRNRAIAQFPLLTMTGFPAWLVWALVHVALLIGFRSRVVVMISWIWNWLTNRRGARIVVGRTRCSAQTPSEDMASSASVQSRGSD